MAGVFNHNLYYHVTPLFYLFCKLLDTARAFSDSRSYQTNSEVGYLKDLPNRVDFSQRDISQNKRPFFAASLGTNV